MYIQNGSEHMPRPMREKTKVLGLRVSEKRRFELDLLTKLLPGTHTMTSVVELAVDTLCASKQGLEDVTRIWSEFESDRFVRQADAFPQSLDHQEQVLWDFINARPEFWPIAVFHQYAEGTKPIQGFNFPLLRSAWDLIRAHLIGGAPWDEKAFRAICEKHGITYEVKPQAASHATKKTKQG